MEGVEVAVPQEEADRLRVSVLLALVLAEALRDGEGEERRVLMIMGKGCQELGAWKLTGDGSGSGS